MGDARVKVMVVEDDLEVGKAISRKLTGDGVELEMLSEPQPVLVRLDEGTADWDVVILDVGLPGMSGIDVLHRFRQAGSLASVIMLTADSTAQTATTCMRAGAFYYLTKPFRPYELSAMVESAARYSLMRKQLADVRHAVQPESLLVGISAAMRKLRLAVDRLATQDVSILIQGESGTGKELVARALHTRGSRRAKRFVALNCGAIPESLIDSELFGHAMARSPARARIGLGSSSRPTAARCSSTRSATCRWRCRRASCACCRRARCVPSVATAFAAWTCA